VFELYSLPHILDSLSNTVCCMAKLLMMFSRWELWVFWVLGAINGMVMWAGASGFGIDYNLTILFTV